MSTPITVPDGPASGPPESPGLIRVLVSSMPCSVSVNPDALSAAWIVRFRPLTTPGTVVGGPSLPAWFPMARTGVPAVTAAESPSGTAVSPAAPCSSSTAMSAPASVPTIRAGYVRPVNVSRALTAVASLMTWLLVSTRADRASTTNPVPEAVSPS